MPSSIVSQQPATHDAAIAQAIRRVLISAAGTVHTQGLWKGSSRGVCAAVAVNIAARRLYPHHAASVEQAALVTLARHLDLPVHDYTTLAHAVGAWADQRHVTTAVAVAAMREAAEQCSKLFGVAA